MLFRSQSPQFEKQNFWMSLEDFKHIFFWEWFHRLLGRLIGMFYALPFVYFLVRKQVPKDRILPLVGIFLLGGAQGFMGWYMVKSGLVDQPAVSHYRLAAHLLLALLIFVLMLRQGLSFLFAARGLPTKADNSLRVHALAALLAIVITIFWGALTAGLDAGLVYNDSFPLMGDGLVPEEVWFYKPLWHALLDIPAGVQFVHRWLAMTTFVIVTSLALRAVVFRKRREWCFWAIGVMALLQVGLGLTTLFSGVALPLAVMHQGGAVLLLTLIVICLQSLKAPTTPQPC